MKWYILFLLKAQRDRQSFTPLTVKQIYSASNDQMGSDTFRIDQAEIAIIKIMGRVESVDEHSTNMSYRVNDGTGVLECKEWLEKDRAPTSNRVE